jgi:YVTN family beta-propeller protein
MRKLIGLIVLLTLPAVAQTVPLPAGGLNFKAPGFTIHTPGAPWLMQAAFPKQSKDGSVEGAYSLIFGASRWSGGNPLARPLMSLLGFGNDSTAIVNVTGMVVPFPGSDHASVLDALMMISRKLEAEEVVDTSRRHYVSHNLAETTLNGAICVGREAVVEDRGVPGHNGEVFTLILHGLLCSDPEYPQYTVRDDYSIRLAPGIKPFVSDEIGMAARNSMTFTHLGYHVTFIPVGPVPQMLAEADGAIWLAYGGQDGKVARIDPKTNAVSAVIPVGNVPVGIAADPSGVWVANLRGDTVQRIDPKTNKAAATIKVPSKPEMIASGAGSIWVTANGAGSVVRIDPTSGSVTEIPGVAKQPAGLVVTNGSVYVTDYASDKIVRIDPATNTIADTIPSAPFSNYVMSDGRYLWANSQDKEPAVLRLDPSSQVAAPLRFTKSIDDMPTGLALWNGKLWVANWAGASVSVLNPQNPDAGGEFLPTGHAPFGILAAQGSLWVSVLGEHAVLRFDPD